MGHKTGHKKAGLGIAPKLAISHLVMYFSILCSPASVSIKNALAIWAYASGLDTPSRLNTSQQSEYSMSYFWLYALWFCGHHGILLNGLSEQLIEYIDLLIELFLSFYSHFPPL